LGLKKIIPPLQGLTLLETSYPRGFAPCYLFRPVGAEEREEANYYAVWAKEREKKTTIAPL